MQKRCADTDCAGRRQLEHNTLNELPSHFSFFLFHRDPSDLIQAMSSKLVGIDNLGSSGKTLKAALNSGDSEVSMLTDRSI
jgi:hypothetical protein